MLEVKTHFMPVSIGLALAFHWVAQAECVKAIDPDQTTITDGVVTEGVLV